MTDEDVIEKAANLLGAKVGKPYQHPNQDYKPVYRFVVYGQDSLVEIFSLLEPHLGARRMEKVGEFRKWLADSKYHYCRKGLHKLDSTTRSNSGSSTRCGPCKAAYNQAYRLRNQE